MKSVLARKFEGLISAGSLAVILSLSLSHPNDGWVRIQTSTRYVTGSAYSIGAPGQPLPVSPDFFKLIETVKPLQFNVVGVLENAEGISDTLHPVETFRICASKPVKLERSGCDRGRGDPTPDIFLAPASRVGERRLNRWYLPSTRLSLGS